MRKRARSTRRSLSRMILDRQPGERRHLLGDRRPLGVGQVLPLRQRLRVRAAGEGADLTEERGQVGGRRDAVVVGGGRGIARQIVDQVLIEPRRTAAIVHDRRQQDDAVELHPVLRQSVRQPARAERAVQFAEDELRAVPAVVDRQPALDAAGEGVDVGVGAPQRLELGIAERARKARADRVDEDEVGLVEQAVGVVLELERRPRRRLPGCRCGHGRGRASPCGATWSSCPDRRCTGRSPGDPARRWYRRRRTSTPSACRRRRGSSPSRRSRYRRSRGRRSSRCDGSARAARGSARWRRRCRRACSRGPAPPADRRPAGCWSRRRGPARRCRRSRRSSPGGGRRARSSRRRRRFRCVPGGPAPRRGRRGRARRRRSSGACGETFRGTGNGG